MSEVKKFSLIKPTITTPFHIDFAWWRENDRNWQVDLRGLLCEEHQRTFADLPEGQMIDYIDPETAEVRQIDGLQNTLIAHCALQVEFVDEHTAMVEAVFRTMLANGNTPMTTEELGQRLHRPADLILKTLSSPRVYKGIRPYIP